MVKLKCKKWDYVILAHVENVSSRVFDEFPVDTFTDPSMDDDIAIIYVIDDEELEYVEGLINSDNLIENDTLIYYAAVEIIYQCARNAIERLITGGIMHDELIEAFEHEPSFDREVWNHAVTEAKRRLLMNLNRS